MPKEGLRPRGGKFQPDLVEKMKAGTWRDLFEWKTSDVDRKLHQRSGGSDGRVWMAINGQVIADVSGSNMGPNNSRISLIFVSQLYSESPYPIYQWVDDLQIWSSFPAAAPGEPWYDSPYAPH